MLFILGASLTFAFAPFKAWWLPFIVFPLWFFVQSQQTKDSFKTAWFFSFGISVHGGVPLIASIGMMSVLCAYLALFPAFAMWLTNRFFDKQFWPLTLPLFWLVLEFARAHFMTGFPWLSIGYSQLHGPLSGWIPLIGEIGVSAILILITVNLGLMLNQFQTNKRVASNQRKAVFVGLILCVSGVVLDKVDWTQESGQVKRVTMVQGNIEQTIRWVPEQDRPTMQKYWNLSSEHWDSDLIIWPEAAIPKLEIAATDFLELLDKKATETNTALITGIVDVNYNTEKIYNNLLSLGNDELNKNTITVLPNIIYCPLVSLFPSNPY